MRKPRDGEGTKQQVIAAAEELFSQKGYAGVSLAEISQKSGISDGLILHHFQNKEQLYRQVLAGLVERYSSALMQSGQNAENPAAGMRQTLVTAFEFMKDDPAYHRMSLWAYLEGANLFSEKESRFVVSLAQQMEQLQRQGQITAQYDPVVLLTMIIGPIHFWLRYREHYQEALNLPQTIDQLDQHFIDQLLQMLHSLFIPLENERKQNETQN